LNDRITSGDRANGGSTGPEGPVAAAGKPGDIEVRHISIGSQSLKVAIRHSAGNRPPLLLFNGIGANWELAKPFLEALTHTTAIIFDVPGVGGSPAPSLPYRPSTLARLAAGLVAAPPESALPVLVALHYGVHSRQLRAAQDPGRLASFRVQIRERSRF